jgi:hypothetical protein
MSKTVTLRKPIDTHNGKTSTLEIKEVTARSFVQHGQAFKVRVKDGDFELDFDDKATMGFLADATGVDTILLQALDARDYIACRTALAHVVLGIAGEDPTEPSADASQS